MSKKFTKKFDKNNNAAQKKPSASTTTQADEVKNVSVEKLDPFGSSEIIGVRFIGGAKTYYFSPNGAALSPGQFVIVSTMRGSEYGSVVTGNTFVSNKEIVPPLRPIIRLATHEDEIHEKENEKLEKEAYKMCLQKIKEHELDMKLIDAKYSFDNTKLLFNFSADGRIDFRDLVRDLASTFHTRIELRQVGIRDEAKLLGGIGICGREFCCSTFLSDFAQVSIKMAKLQDLSLNSSKISGSCGRLMCCLRYENDTYADILNAAPSLGSKVQSGSDVGIVTEISPLQGTLKMKVQEKNGDRIDVVPLSDVKILERKNSHKVDSNTSNRSDEDTDIVEDNE